jgi:hypothetical protein
VWHASIALRDDAGPVRTSTVDRRRRRLAFALAARLLDGVGVGDAVEQVKEHVFHVRRKVSPRELAAIDQAWLAVPAVDGGG